MIGRDNDSVLAVDDLSLRFGGVRALDGVSFRLRADSVLALIGPNGAGKTSVFNCLNQIYRPERGSIRLSGRELIGLAPYEVAAAGLARTFQNPALFGELSVLDNLMVGRHHLMRTGFARAAWGWGRSRQEERTHRNRCEGVAARVGLGGDLCRPVRLLPYGIQKRVELARALAMEPQVLLLDEPVAGMNTAERGDMVTLLRDLRRGGGPTMMLIEHDMAVVGGLADRVVVLDFGRVIAEGSPSEVQVDPRVTRAYLGGALTASENTEVMVR
jgi:branched-chain amino acid transport system ATP-binding protein